MDCICRKSSQNSSFIEEKLHRKKKKKKKKRVQTTEVPHKEGHQQKVECLRESNKPLETLPHIIRDVKLKKNSNVIY